MKRVFAFLLILVTLFGLAACTDKGTDVNGNIKYIYDDAGRVIKEERYSCDFDGEYILSRTFEYAYDENGNLKVKRLYDESTTERRSQTHKYDYNSAGQRLREEIYNHEQELVCTTTYTYGDDRKILSKEILHSKMGISYCSTTVDGEELKYHGYGPGYEYEADGAQYFGNDYLFTDEVLDESATYRILIDYYSNGVEKTRSEFRGDTLLVYKEYAEVGELEKQILSAEPGGIVGIYNEEGEEYLCEVGGNRYYKPCEDGTLETLVNALVDIYTYYPDGTVKSKESYDKDLNYVQNEYYESGALMLHAEGKDYNQAAWSLWVFVRAETYYEDGTLKSREECKYSTEEVFGVDYSLKEEFYESGAKKSVKEYDAEKGIDNYTQWDEEGNVIPAEEE